MLLLILAFLLVCSFRIVPGAFGQTVTFGVVTGASLTGDFGNLSCTAPPGDVLTGPGCPRIIGADSLTVSNASKRLILGPRVHIPFSTSLSVECVAGSALHPLERHWQISGCASESVSNRSRSGSAFFRVDQRVRIQNLLRWCWWLGPHRRLEDGICSVQWHRARFAHGNRVPGA